MIEYRYTKDFDEKQIEELFLSVSWPSGKFLNKLKMALHNSSKVISAWDGEKLIGLIRGLDDGIWQATIDCLLVNPEHQGIGIASTLLKRLLDDYKEFCYVDVVPDEKKNVEFYLKHGFDFMTEGTPMQIKGTSWE